MSVESLDRKPIASNLDELGDPNFSRENIDWTEFTFEYPESSIRGKAPRPVTVRISNNILQDLKALAVLDGTTLGDQLRAAAEMHIGEAKSDPELPAKIQAEKLKSLKQN